MQAHSFDHPPSTFRVWVRGIWQLPGGRRITRTVSREIVCEPGDEERILIAFDALVEELRAEGHLVPQGRGQLVEVLGTAHG
jgi:hypothetical protein